MLDVKQCPFCASNQYYTSGKEYSTHYEPYIVCSNCGATGPTGMTIASAIDNWNMRRKEMPAAYFPNKLQSK